VLEEGNRDKSVGALDDLTSCDKSLLVLDQERAGESESSGDTRKKKVEIGGGLEGFERDCLLNGAIFS